MKRREVMALEYPQNLYTLIFRKVRYGEYGDPYPKELIPSTTEVGKMMEDVAKTSRNIYRHKIEVFLKRMKGQSARDIAKEYNVSSSAINQKINIVERLLSCNKNKFILEHGLAAYEAKKASDEAAEKAAEEKAKKEFEERLSNPDTRLDALGEINISDIGLSIRPLRALSHCNIDTVVGIIKHSPSEILSKPNIGMVSFIEIVTVLEERFNIIADMENDKWIV